MVEFVLGRRELLSMSDAEGSYGVAGDRKIAFGRNASISPDTDDQNWTEVNGAGMNVVDVQDRELGVKSAGFILNYTPQDWRFLKYVLLGAKTDVTDTSSGGHYIHTFTNSQSGLLSFSFERNRQKSNTNIVELYRGCQVSDYSLTWDSNDVNAFLQASATIVAKDFGSIVTPTTLSPSTARAFKPRQVKLTLEGGVQGYLLNGTLTVTNQLDEARYSNSENDRFKAESALEKRTFKLTGTLKVQDSTYFDMYDSATALTGTNKLEFIRGSNDELAITFTNAYLNHARENTNFEGANTVSVDIDINTCSFVAKDTLNNYSSF